MDDKQQVAELLATQKYMVLAVVTADGAPWPVPVYIQRQDGNEFEWDSKLDTVHSQAIATNSKTAITIYTTEHKTGFYAVGTSTLVESRDDGYGRYRFTAEQCWLNDETFVKREVEI